MPFINKQIAKSKHEKQKNKNVFFSIAANDNRENGISLEINKKILIIITRYSIIDNDYCMNHSLPKNPSDKSWK